MREKTASYIIYIYAKNLGETKPNGFNIQNTIKLRITIPTHLSMVYILLQLNNPYVQNMKPLLEYILLPHLFIIGAKFV